MGRSISSDLRLRMVRGIASGKSRREVAAQFEVAPSTAVRVRQRYERSGSIAPPPPAGDARAAGAPGLPQ